MTPGANSPSAVRVWLPALWRPWHFTLPLIGAGWLGWTVGTAHPFTDVINEDADRFTSLLSSAVPERRVEGAQGLANLKHWPAEGAVLRSCHPNGSVDPLLYGSMRGSFDVPMRPVMNQCMQRKVPGHVRDVTFRNVTVNGQPGAYRFHLAGADESHAVRDVRFENVSVLGTNLTPGSPRLSVGTNVSGVSFGAARGGREPTR